MISRPYQRGPWWIRVYDLFYTLLQPWVGVVSLFIPKLRKAWCGMGKGVTGWRITIREERSLLLFHTASRGEYETIVPLLKKLAEGGCYNLAVSFSSPSVEALVRSSPYVSASGYIPRDELSGQLRLLAQLEPVGVFISKHDLWPNFLRACQALRVPVFLINAHFSPSPRLNFSPSWAIYNRLLTMLDEIWTVSSECAEMVEKWTAGKVKVRYIGDMRYDRVWERAIEGKRRFADLRKYLKPGLIGVLGSSWPKEERLALQVWKRLKPLFPQLRLIIAPHEWDEKRLKGLEKEWGTTGIRAVRLARWLDDPHPVDIILVDLMGILAELYALGDWALVGGGFGAGVHSVIEPAANGIPVLFGPRYRNSNEAAQLLNRGGGIVIKDSGDLFYWWKRWAESDEECQNTGHKALQVVEMGTGATEKVYEQIKALMPAHKFEFKSPGKTGAIPQG